MLTILRRAVLILMLLVTVVVTYAGGKARHLDQAVPERHRIYGIPIAVSKALYGLDGYVAYQAIARRFVNDKPIDVILSQDLPRNSKGVPDIPAVERAEGLFFVPADDKGDVTFTRMAFWLFGVNLQALYRMYFLLLLGSVGAYVLIFYRDGDRLLIALCVLLALFTLPGAFQTGLLVPFVVTFYDPRIFCLIAVLAILHLGFSCLDSQRMSPLRFACAIYQVFIVVLAVHVRSAGLWLVFALLAWIAITAGRRMMAPRSPDKTTGGVLARLAGTTHVAPLIMLGVGFATLLMWERVTYDRRYYTTHMAHHLFWHNAGLAFALHPQLGKAYDYITLDESMMNRVARYLFSRGDNGTLVRIFGSAYSNTTGTADGVHVDVGPFLHSPTSDLSLYNDVVGQIVFETVRAHPWQTAALFAYYKPRYVFSFLMWLMIDRPAVDGSGHQRLGIKGVSFTPVRPAGIGLLVLMLSVAWPLGMSRLSAGLLPAALLMLFSLLPQMITYPGGALMGEPLFAVSFVLYMAIAVALISISRTISVATATA
jgi:hypothetical protein